MFPKTYFILQNQFEQTDFDGENMWTSNLIELVNVG